MTDTEHCPRCGVDVLKKALSDPFRCMDPRCPLNTACQGRGQITPALSDHSGHRPGVAVDNSQAAGAVDPRYSAAPDIFTATKGA